jgi:hypothetical protein
MKKKDYEPRWRIHLELPEPFRGKVTQLRSLTEADTVTEVVRRALELYDVLMTATKERKMRLILRDENGTEHEILLP